MRTGLCATVTTGLALAGTAGAGGTAGAQLPVPAPPPAVSDTDVDPFYDTSTVTPRAAGEVLRTATAAHATVVPGVDTPAPATAEKLLYTTLDAHGAPRAVSGYMVEPTVPWSAPGERPTVVVGRGTAGQGDECAASRNWPLDGQPFPLQSGRRVALEGAYDWAFAAAGVRVVVTDYVGLGTPGVHTYMNRDEQAHAMIDAGRAARSVVTSGGGRFGEVAFYGHSQGGGASAAAVEAAPSYAPDLPVVAAYASAPPANLDDVQRRIDGSDLMGAIGFAINGLVARYPRLQDDLDARLDEAGHAALADVAGMCTDEVTRAYGDHTTAEWTTTGERLDALLDELPAGREAMEAQRIGTMTPTVPVMVVSGRHDDTVDYRQAKDLAATWCSRGAPVVYRDDVLPPLGTYNHFAQAVSGAAFGIPFLLDRFHGVPVAPSCP